MVTALFILKIVYLSLWGWSMIILADLMIDEWKSHRCDRTFLPGLITTILFSIPAAFGLFRPVVWWTFGKVMAILLPWWILLWLGIDTGNNEVIKDRKNSWAIFAIDILFIIIAFTTIGIDDALGDRYKEDIMLNNKYKTYEVKDVRMKSDSGSCVLWVQFYDENGHLHRYRDFKIREVVSEVSEVDPCNIGGDNVALCVTRNADPKILYIERKTGGGWLAEL